MSTLAKLGLLGTLYLSQGLPFGFFTQALPVLMRKQDIALPAIGLVSLLALPWALKFLWAPVLDRHGSARVGRRRSWILPLQASAIALMLAVAALNPQTQLPLVLAAVLLANLVAATQDIASDGLAVSLLAPHERGRGNGVQVAGYRVGMILGGGVLLLTFDWFGWRGTFLAIAAALALASLPILRHQEAPRSEPATRAPTLTHWRSFARLPGMSRWLVLLLVYKLGDAFGTGMLRPLLVDLGFDLADIGGVLGLGGFTTGLIGALLGGYAVERIGRKRALLAFGLLQAMSLACFTVVALQPSYGAVLVVSLIEHLTSGMATAALFTAMMDRTRPGSEASDYTVQASAVVIATGAASALSGFSAEALGYPTHFGLGTLLAVAALAWVPRGFGARDLPVLRAEAAR